MRGPTKATVSREIGGLLYSGKAEHATQVRVCAAGQEQALRPFVACWARGRRLTVPPLLIRLNALAVLAMTGIALTVLAVIVVVVVGGVLRVVVVLLLRRDTDDAGGAAQPGGRDGPADLRQGQREPVRQEQGHARVSRSQRRERPTHSPAPVNRLRANGDWLSPHVLGPLPTST